MGFFSRLVSNSEAAEHSQKKNEEKAKESWIKIQKKINPSRSIASIEAEWQASRENSPRARDTRLFEADKQYWEDIAAGKIPKDTPLPSKAWFDSLSPQEQQAEQNRKQQNFQASQIRAHNDLVESMTRKLQNNIALYGRDNANSVFMETELKKLTAQQPVFAPIGAAPIVNVTVASPNASQSTANQLLEVGNDALWEQAAAEIESGERKETLWIKCFSQAGGDENKAKAFYYEARVKQLVSENAVKEIPVAAVETSATTAVPASVSQTPELKSKPIENLAQDDLSSPIQDEKAKGAIKKYLIGAAILLGAIVLGFNYLGGPSLSKADALRIGGCAVATDALFKAAEKNGTNVEQLKPLHDIKMAIETSINKSEYAKSLKDINEGKADEKKRMSQGRINPMSPAQGDKVADCYEWMVSTKFIPPQ